MMNKTKRALAMALILALVLSYMPFSFAEGGYITVDKDFYLVADAMTITVSGLSESQINDQGAYLSIHLKGDSDDTSAFNGMYTYVSSLRDGKTWTIDAPNELNDFEVRLYVTEGDALSLLQSVPFVGWVLILQKQEILKSMTITFS